MWSRSRLCLIHLCLLVVLGASAVEAFPAEPWSTYRGNIYRTGNTDNIPGPTAPKVLWALKSQEHYIAAPVPFGDRLYIAGLGAFNVSTFHCLAVDPKAAERTVWSKTTPLLKLPTVSSPAIIGGKLVFGDGMHQTDGAILYSLRLDKGLPVWQLPVLGKLVHLEGSPTVEGKRVYIGGGAAGVLCVDLDRVTLEGREQDVATVQKVLDQKWKELLAKYEEDKKKDPCFAVPPNEDQLPKPAPVRVWEQGAEQWHVDAPVAVVGDRVLAGSAYLDKEKLGDRAVYCIDAGSGDIRWRAALKLNPWGGPSVAGDIVVVGGSTIGYDPKALSGARGTVTALDLATGKTKWQKDVPGGVVSCVALSGDLAVFTATDGKVRAFDLTNGEWRWVYDAKVPFFAPPAVTAETVYAGDLKGVVHAVQLADGKPKWTLDLGKDPAVLAPGMIYGGPVLQAGRLFVATCNLEGPHANRPTAIVCIGNQ
jgi:outer membrane protein assembly factor BamB